MPDSEYEVPPARRVRTKRLWTPVPYGSMVNDVARVSGVVDWTDVAPGNGRITATATEGLALRQRRLIIPAHQQKPQCLEHWQHKYADLVTWAGTERGDCVSLFDVIEHLIRPDADDVLTRLERSYRLVVVFTPRGFMRQDPTTNAELANDPTMWHRSGFVPRDFKDRGYLTYVWPLYHPGAGVGAILALRPSARAATIVDAAVISRYRLLASRESTIRAIGRWARARLVQALVRRRRTGAR